MTSIPRSSSRSTCRTRSTTQRYRLQMEGIAQALEDPGVIQAIVGGAKGGILFSMITWADRPKVNLPWTYISQRRRGARDGEARARASAPGRRVHLHVAHDALRLRQDRAADSGQGRQGGARHLRRRPRQLQRGGAGRLGARRARQIRRHRQRLADSGGQGAEEAEGSRRRADAVVSARRSKGAPRSRSGTATT